MKRHIKKCVVNSTMTQSQDHMHNHTKTHKILRSQTTVPMFAEENIDCYSPFSSALKLRFQLLRKQIFHFAINLGCQDVSIIKVLHCIKVTARSCVQTPERKMLVIKTLQRLCHLYSRRILSLAHQTDLINPKFKRNPTFTSSSSRQTAQATAFSMYFQSTLHQPVAALTNPTIRKCKNIYVCRGSWVHQRID